MKEKALLLAQTETAVQKLAVVAGGGELRLDLQKGSGSAVAAVAEENLGSFGAAAAFALADRTSLATSDSVADSVADSAAAAASSSTAQKAMALAAAAAAAAGASSADGAAALASSTDLVADLDVHYHEVHLVTGDPG